MPTGTRQRVTGRLTSSARGLILEVEDGGVYALDTDPEATDLLGHRVTIEGIRSGFDRIAVEWIGKSDMPGEPGQRSPDRQHLS